MVKDLSLSLLWLGSLLWHRFDPWPGNFCMPWVQPPLQKKIKKAGIDSSGEIERELNFGKEKEKKKKEEITLRSSHCGDMEMNPTRNCEVAGSISGLAPWVMDPALP